MKICKISNNILDDCFSGNSNLCQKWKSALSKSIHIDQIVYFLQYTPQMTISEVYTINKVQVDNHLGTFHKLSSIQNIIEPKNQKARFDFRPSVQDRKNSPSSKSSRMRKLTKPFPYSLSQYDV